MDSNKQQRLIFLAVAIFLVSGCGNNMSKYFEEKKMPVSIISNQHDSIGPALLGYTNTQSQLVWMASKPGTYVIKTAGSCDSGTTSTGTNASGTISPGMQITSVINWSDIPRGGGTVSVCVTDPFNFAKESASRGFTTPSGASLTTLVQAQNDSVGGSGTAINSGVSAPYTLFQDSFVSGVGDNRSSGATAVQNGIKNGYSHGAYIDPNDDYKLKYFVNDRGNNRVLIFNSIPTSSASAPDVVVGQSSFVTSNAATTSSGFSSNTHVSVCANGIMYVSDQGNHRIMAFSRVPKTNGEAAAFVIGQADFTTAVANYPIGTVGANTLRNPYASHCVGGRLFILDRNNARVVVFNIAPTTGVPLSTAATADYVIGRPDLTTSSAPVANYATPTFSNSYLNASGLYEIGSFNNAYYIVDGINHRVLVYNTIPTVSDVKPDFAIGQAVAGGNSSGLTQSTLNTPNSLAFKGTKIAVADTTNLRITFYDLPIAANGPNATHQLGQVDFTSNTSGTAQGKFGSGGAIKGLIFDGTGYIWVMDGGQTTGNNRVQILPLPY